MSVPSIKSSFVVGEVSPSLYGHVDLSRYAAAASTMRNLFVRYQGGAYSRAGTQFVGYSKQNGTIPPRLIPFQFRIDQGLALEFGDFYMRVISDGDFVTDVTVAITNITQANPAVVTFTPPQGAVSAIADNSGVTVSYKPSDQITLAGGDYTEPAILQVDTTLLLDVDLNAVGTGYVPGDTIDLAGGTQTTTAVVTVQTTKVVAVALNAGGAGGTPGVQTVTGTTGTGTKFQCLVLINGAGNAIAVGTITVAGSYSVNPTLVGEPVTGAGLVGCTLDLTMGVDTISLSNPGEFTVNAPAGQFTQGATSGTGTGATFNNGLFGISDISIADAGIYASVPPNNVAQASNTGLGTGATFAVTWGTLSLFANDDWFFISGVLGMTQVNGDTYVIQNLTPTTFELLNVYGETIDSTTFSAYASGGSAARIFTLETPYAEEDLEWIKYTQSADVMSLCCVNQETLTEYAPQDLRRLSAIDWTFTPAVPVTSITPPASVTGAASAAGTVNYAYKVTAVSPEDGSESIASGRANVSGAVNIATTAGTITLTWTPITGVRAYNIYKATPGDGVGVPSSVLFGYAGTAYGVQFIDTSGGIIPDFSQVPPLHDDPFARGRVIAAEPSAGGAGYTTITITISTSTGSGAVLGGILNGGALTAVLILDPGQNYLPSDVAVVTGDGAGAAVDITIGALSGTYPSVPAYFQQRRFYASSLNQPDTYWMSQPGAYLNFDFRIPTIDSDAITGTPWAVQVNGIQFATPMPGGLVVHTGLGAWQLTGSGGGSLNPQPITPASQGVQPQGNNGCSATIPPIKIDQNIVFVQAKNSIYRNISYQIQGNIYAGADLTINSSHLFTGYTIQAHAWCEEPFRILWAVRDDGVLLSFTFLQSQEVASWARHDTNGLFVGCCSVTEPPVDALYLATRRFPGVRDVFMIERMDNRIWGDINDCWCVDCGLALTEQLQPATLFPRSATGLGAITGATELVGGEGYSAGTTAEVVDDNGEGPGTGAVIALTIAGGVITGVTATVQGAGYINPSLVITDPANTGQGASARLTLDNSTIFDADDTVFTAGHGGNIILAAGGVAVVDGYISDTSVRVQIISPLTDLVPNSGGRVAPQAANTWSMTAPVSTVNGLQHLIGATVTGLAGGNVITPRTVNRFGQITLDAPSFPVVVGLGFRAQLQTVRLDAGNPTIQGQRKAIKAVTARIEASRGLTAGANQPDGAAQSPPRVETEWRNMTPISDEPNEGNTFPAKPYNSPTTPLRTGDVRLPVVGGFATQGQVAIEQSSPLPMQILALIPETDAGDAPQVQWPKRRTAA